jgi:choloylglycine hydrolase
MKKMITHLVAIAATALMYANPGMACTDFQVKAKDGTLFITRSMEFSIEFNSNLRSSTQGRTFTTTAPNGKPALSWKANYGYLYLDGLNQDIAVDGINEKGLAFEFLYLPGNTQYQTVPAGKESQSLPYYLFGDWVLSNFKTIDEVRQALANVSVFAQTLPSLGNVILPAHAAIHDASGKGIVVEFVDGKMNIYDYIGVMTNSPTYDWQVINLRNYLNLSPYSPKPVVVDGISYAATGQGAGMVGLPGDTSPPSRFVKTAFITKNSNPANNAMDALNLSQHIINNVDIAAGMVRGVENGKETTETTQWVVFKDLTHKIFYYRTYNDMTVRAVAMDKIDFSSKASRLKMPLNAPPTITDVTGKFLNTNLNTK